MEFVSQLPPETLGAIAVALLLMVWVLLVLTRRAKRQPMAQQSQDEFAQRRIKPAESTSPPRDTPQASPPAAVGAADRLQPPTPAPASAPAVAATTPSSDSRWMQSRIPVADTRELSDSELQAWSPTEVMPKRDDR